MRSYINTHFVLSMLLVTAIIYTGNGSQAAGVLVTLFMVMAGFWVIRAMFRNDELALQPSSIFIDVVALSLLHLYALDSMFNTYLTIVIVYFLFFSAGLIHR